MKKSYNKLVRDRIPEIIESTGKSCTIEILNTDVRETKATAKQFHFRLLKTFIEAY